LPERTVAAVNEGLRSRFQSAPKKASQRRLGPLLGCSSEPRPNARVMGCAAACGAGFARHDGIPKGPLMARRNSSWLSLSMSAMQLGIEAQSVIALRMMKVSAGGAAAEAEVQRMISEKTEAALDAQLQIGRSAMSGL